MFIGEKKFYVFSALVILTIFFLVTEVPLFAVLFGIAAVITIIPERVGNWFKKGKEEAIKTEGYYPEDKLKEYWSNASKKTAEVVAPDKKTPVDVKGMPHRIPTASKNFFSELEKIFK